MEMEWNSQFFKDESSLPNKQLELIWISPVRDSVYVDCNRHIIVQERLDQSDIPTSVRD